MIAEQADVSKYENDYTGQTKMKSQILLSCSCGENRRGANSSTPFLSPHHMQLLFIITKRFIF